MVGSSLSLRSRLSPEEVTFECDLRLRYRGINRAVLLMAGSMAFVILGYVVLENTR